MRVNTSTRFAAVAVMVGALACAGNTQREADTDETAAARDTTMSDTLGGQQNAPRDRGMEGDSVNVQYPETSDTFLQNQGPGQGQGQDTAGYSGMERVDTTGQQGQGQQGQDTWQTDTTGQQGQGQDTWQTDTTGQQGMQTDTTGAAGDTGAWGADTAGANQGEAGAGAAPTGDTTGYDQSQ